jgi:hypothetical protein
LPKTAGENMTPTITPVGDWGPQVSGPLNYAMGLWSGAAGRTRDQVTKQATAFMAQSAGKLTTQSKARRKIERHPLFGDFVPIWRKGREVPVFLGSRLQNPEKYEEIKARVTPINLKGLARSSWKWGLQKLGASGGTAKFSDRKNVVKAGPVTEAQSRGHEIVNRLSYIGKIMPGGWGPMVAQSAANRMRSAAERRMTQDLNRSVSRASGMGASLTR